MQLSRGKGYSSISAEVILTYSIFSWSAINTNLACSLSLPLFWSTCSILIPQELANWFSKAQNGKLQPTERILPASYRPPLRQSVTPQESHSTVSLMSITTPFPFYVFYFYFIV